MYRIAIVLVACTVVACLGSAKFARVAIGPGNSVTVKEMNDVEASAFYETEIAPRVAAQVAALLGAVVADMNEVDARIAESELRLRARIDALPLGMEPNTVQQEIRACELRAWQVSRDMCDGKIKEFETVRLNALMVTVSARLTELSL